VINKIHHHNVPVSYTPLLLSSNKYSTLRLSHIESKLERDLGSYIATHNKSTTKKPHRNTKTQILAPIVKLWHQGIHFFPSNFANLQKILRTNKEKMIGLGVETFHSSRVWSKIVFLIFKTTS
jgi:hypothetical protein